jgi:hypothetical protein
MRIGRVVRYWRLAGETVAANIVKRITNMKKLAVVLLAALLSPLGWAASNAAAAPAPSTLKGEVLEALDVDAYTYLRLKTANGEVWAAVNKSPGVKVGSEVTIHDPALMKNFESKTLKRTFPSIVFGTLGVAAAGAPAPTAAGANPHGAGPGLGQIHGGASGSADVPAVKVAKAEGPDARTVAEVNVNRVALKDKPVTIRAQVVKVNANVMGKNWVHLRDGSGSAADSSNDLVVTSNDEPKVGDVVLAKGVVKTDVDLGSGYSYKVLVENTTFRK